MRESELIRSIIQMIIEGDKTDCIEQLAWLFSEYKSALNMEEYEREKHGQTAEM